jgi:hypothetical protein
MKGNHMNEVAVVQQNNIVSLSKWDDLLGRAEYLSKSELIPSALRGKPSSVAIVLQIGCELGISPMQALNGISVIQGKPGVDPQLAIALIRQRIPGAVIKFKGDETRAEVTMARSKDSLDEGYTAVWTMEKAKKMQLASKDNYIKQPGTMLRWRATMEAARMVFPDILKGMYSGEELDGIVDDDSNDKAKSIQERIAAAKEIKSEPVTPTVEVVAEVVESKINEPAPDLGDPIKDYAIKSDGPMKGKTLGSIDLALLSQYAAAVKAKFTGAGKIMTGAHLEDITRIDQFLESFKEPQDTFANFNCDVMVK